MHELAMCEGVLDAVEQRARGRPVTRVGVRAGTLLRVDPGAFQACFELVALDGVAEGATPEVTITPVHATCVACELEHETHDPFPACPGCGGVKLQRDGGDELILEWLEYADPDSQNSVASVPEPTDNRQPARS